MREQAVAFGAAGNLAGILCEPDRPAANTPAVLLWNVGIHHRVGAYRIWVDLARRLAEAGYTSLRFDLSGMGDSEPRRGGGDDPTYREDFEDAMAFVTRRTGIATFLPIGFCSGVDQLHGLGLRDARVVGMGYIEAYSWKTNGYWLRYPLRYLRGTLWDNRLANLSRRPTFEKLARLVGRAGSSPELAVDLGGAENAGGAAMFSRQYPSQERFADEVGTLRRRNVKLLFAYFGLETGFSHAGQFQEMTGIAPDGDGLRVYFLGGADHILYRVEDRALALAEVVGWVKSAFPAESVGTGYFFRRHALVG